MRSSGRWSTRAGAERPSSSPPSANRPIAESTSPCITAWTSEPVTDCSTSPAERGLAVELATLRGARGAGIDASPRLLAIARDRNPEADLRVGDMNALPWDDGSFDVVTSFRGIWGTTPSAVAEAHRVLVPVDDWDSRSGDTSKCPPALGFSRRFRWRPSRKCKIKRPWLHWAGRVPERPSLGNGLYGSRADRSALRVRVQ